MGALPLGCSIVRLLYSILFKKTCSFVVRRASRCRVDAASSLHISIHPISAPVGRIAFANQTISVGSDEKVRVCTRLRN